ncbi:hypothetical protein PQX77_012946 [Marasmius sp. AFHP31]|nr:hypothetical protein PQX77_012946 [Marasmius sp. AFHP31]
MSTSKLKRNISNDPQNDATSKKPKIRRPQPLQSKFPSHSYETPHPTSQSQSEVYKLPSSVGEPISPSDFSPLPRTARKISSTSLKENAGKSPFAKERFNKKKYGKNKSQKGSSRALESPFIPSSPAPGGIDVDDELDRNAKTGKRGLSNTGYDPNVLGLGTGIARIQESPIKARRPSAPTPPRRSEWKLVQNNNASAVDLGLSDSGGGGLAQDFNEQERAGFGFQRDPNHSINFNRPPSQLSLYDYNRSLTYEGSPRQDGFFTGIRDESTPFKLPSLFNPPSIAQAQAQASHRSMLGGSVSSALIPLSRDPRDVVSDTDTDSDGLGRGYGSREGSLKFASRTRARSSDGSGYATPSAEDSEDDENDSQRSPWVEDSLISAPDTRDWRAPARKRGYMRDVKNKKDVEMADVEDSESALESIFDSLIIVPSASADDETTVEGSKQRSPSGSHIPGTPPFTRAEIPHATIVRTRSLGDSDDLPLSLATASNPVTAAVAAPPPALARRTRSGTVVAATSYKPALAPALPVISGVFRRTRSGTVVSGKVENPGVGTVTDGLASGNHAMPTTVSTSSLPPRRTRSGTVVLATAASATSERDKVAPNGSNAGTGLFGARRTRSGSIQIPPTLPSVGEAGAQGPPLANAPPVRRSRSGSIAALANTVGAKLASLPLPGTGMLHRARSGTVVKAPALPPVANPRSGEIGASDVEMDDGVVDGRPCAGIGDGGHDHGDGPRSSPDPLDFFAHMSPDSPHMTGVRERGTGPRDRRGGSRSGMALGKGKSKSRLVAADAMDIDEDAELSDDPLLLKPKA